MLFWIVMGRLLVAVVAHPVKQPQGADEVQCGVSPAVAKYSNINSANRILGGHPSVDGDWPWVVHLKVDVDCTGFIVSRNWVLTAAHCLIEPGSEVGFGSVVISKMSKVRVQKVVENFFPYRDYDSLYDIALIKVESPFDLNVTTPLCLQRNLPFNKQAVAAGFSRDFDHGKIKRHELWETQLPLVGNVNCEDNDAAFVCAGGVQAGTTSGDSGGPLMQLHNGRFVCLGITSFGKYLEFPWDPFAKLDRGVYTRISFYCDWIEKNTDGEVVCRD